MGIFFAIWLSLGAVGSLVAKFIRKNFGFIFLILTIFEGVYLIISLAIIRLYPTLLNLSPGQILSVYQSSLLILLAPGIFSFCQGIRFVAGANFFKIIISQGRGPGVFYGWEAAGALTGGFVFAFIIQKYTNPFETACIVSLLNLISCLPLFTIKNKQKKLVFVWVSTFFLLLSFFFFPKGGFYSWVNDITLLKQWHLQDPPKYWVNTHYGNILVFEKNSQISFIVDGRLLFSVPYPDKEWIETTVHFPMLFSNRTNSILIIGAGMKGTIPEILKYDVERIDCVEINPELIDAIKTFSPSNFPGYGNEKIHIIQDDALRMLKKTTNKWDVIILDAGVPFSLKTARFYTKEFFQLIKRHLSKNGIFYLVVEGFPEYMSDPLVGVHRILYSSLKTVFHSVQVVPGYSTGYCSAINDVPEMTAQLMSSRKKEKRIYTNIITDFYLKEKLNREKKEQFLNMIDGSTRLINTGNRPFIVIPALEYWLLLSTGNTQGIEKSFLIIVITLFAITLILFFPLTKQKKTKILEFTVMSTGFVTIALELIFMFLFQLYHGSLYFYLSILTGLFMGGMAAGSLIFSRIVEIEKNWTRYLFIWQIVQLIFISVILLLTAKDVTTKIFFFFSMAVVGFFVGWEFPLVNKIYLSKEKVFSDSISRFYAADLSGATLGSILTPIFLISAVGILNSLIFLFFLKSIMGFIVWKMSKYQK
ncbi:MAG: hypothetical protein NC913_01255 [Candidatus Omnitrophica bacterium]|nr:hypothetical protein [Candidatus Omnitrophota bacterium]